MKRSLIVVVCTFLLCQVNAFARPIPQEELDRVNQFLKAVGSMRVGEVDGGFTAGEENEEGVITALAFKMSFEKNSSVSFSLDVADDIEFAANACIQHEKVNFEDVISFIGGLPHAHEAAAESGIYQLSSDLQIKNAQQTTLQAALCPVDGQEHSIKSLTIDGQLDCAAHSASVNGKACLNVEGELVKRARTALTAAFGSLRTGTFPSDEVMSELSKIFAEIWSKIEERAQRAAAAGAARV